MEQHSIIGQNETRLGQHHVQIRRMMHIRHLAIKRARREERMTNLHPNKNTGKIITGHKAIPPEQLRLQGGTDLAGKDEIDHEGA